MKLKIGVIFGGKSLEHEMSIITALQAMENIDTDKYEVVPIYITKNLEWYTGGMLRHLDSFKDFDLIKRYAKKVNLVNKNGRFVLQTTGLIARELNEIHLAFPMVHGANCEDGTIQGLFELAGIPYVGCRVLGSSVSMDKIYTKKILDTAGIPQVKSLYVKKRYDDKLVIVDNNFQEHEKILNIVKKELGFPVFIKASRSGSSVGCFRCNKEEDLINTLQEAAKYDRHIVVEECIDCIELETAVLGNDDVIVSRVGQIMPHGEFYTFESKYEDAESKTCIPALVDEKIQEEIRKLAIKAFKAIDGKGLSRVDFFVERETNKIYINEINTMPGFTKISMYPKLFEAVGVSYSELLDKLIENAIK